MIYTIGHSTRTIEQFIALLKGHGVELLVDVRRFPGSRRHPHFGSAALAASLAAAGIAYAHAEALKMSKILARVEERVPVAAQVARRAHAVEEEREVRARGAGVEAVARGVHAYVRRAARVQLREERAEPVGVFVVDGYRRQGLCHADSLRK